MRATRAVVQVAAVAALVGLGGLVTGCGGDDSAESPPRETPTTSAAERTTTTAGATTKDTKATDAAGVPAWDANAVEFRGQDGTTHTQDCPPNPDGRAGSVWGAGTYTDDSSICTAAVQSGLVTFADGGKATFEIAPGEERYDGGTANGVTSSSYGSWEGSFTFPDAPPGSVDMGASTAAWSQDATAQRGQDGTRVTVRCAGGGTPGSVWGSGPYTDDSSVCTAAVHAGAITQAQGGDVTIEIAPGQPSYRGSTANGVTTSDYGSFSGSFVVVDG